MSECQEAAVRGRSRQAAIHGGEGRGTGLRGRRAHTRLTSRSHSRYAESNDTAPLTARVRGSRCVHNPAFQSVTFRIIWSRFENYLASLACVRKPDKAPKFLYLDFILSFLPKIWCPRATIQSSLSIGKNTEVSFTVPMRLFTVGTEDK